MGGRSYWESAPRVNDQNDAITISDGANGVDNIDDVNLLEVNWELNQGNHYLPKPTSSSTKVILANSHQSNWIKAEPDDGFAQSLYYNNDMTATIYKMPLQKLIDRFLPKASLLTSWYYTKTPNSAGAVYEEEQPEENFAVDELISDMKTIYNYYCWNAEEEENGIQRETVDVLQYRSDGTVLRDEDGKAVYESGDRNYASTNKGTFIYFGQVGLETNRFSLFDFYKAQPYGSNAGPCADTTITGAPDTATIPIVTDLLSDDASFMNPFDLKAKVQYEYVREYTEAGFAPGAYSPVRVYGAARTYISTGVGSAFSLSGYGRTDEEIQRFKDEHPNVDMPQQIFTMVKKGYNGYRCSGINVNTTQGYTDYEYEAYTTVTKYELATDESTLMLPFVPNNVTAKTDPLPTISDYIFYKAIQAAEAEMNNNATVKNAQKYTQESQEKQLVNYQYLFPDGATIKNTNEVWASYITNFDGYHQILPFYNFNMAGPGFTDILKKEFKEQILKAAKLYLAEDFTAATYDDNYKQILESLIRNVGAKTFTLSNGTTVTTIAAPNVPFFPDDMPTPATCVGIVGFKKIEIEDYKTEPTYTTAFDYTDKNGDRVYAVYDITEEELCLTMNVPQKRMSAMLITSGETWSKSMTYSNNITQNSFNPDNYRFVIPHSFFGFGLTSFDINEQPTYRVNLYKKYFSSGNEEQTPLIKEADVMSMLMRWEEAGIDGTESAYVFMRDLYKLVMYIRDEGRVLETAYSYLYIPDSIWDFREGITQEAWWTERLAADSYGPDKLSEEEQEKIIVKKNEISWQIVDYENYEECMVGGKAKAFALFPFSSPYTRAYYMEDALKTGTFDHGGYQEGHGGADWYSRARASQILSDGRAGELDSVATDIYNYEIERRTIFNILNSPGREETLIDDALEFLWDDPLVRVQNPAYQKAKLEVESELEHFSIYGEEVSVAPGVVTKAGYNCYGGFSVHVAHSGVKIENGKITGTPTSKTTYAHMRRWPEVQVGDIVGAGTLLGYEGTTGNSGGVHLHMGINVKGKGESPAKYMAPIFTPFYNSEKASEVLQEYREAAGDDRLIFGSEYYSLIRTSLLAKFDDDKLNEKYENGLNLAVFDATYLSDASFIISGDSEYIIFKRPRDDQGDLILGILHDDRYIVKEGIAEPKYWACDIETSRIGSGDTILFKVISKYEIEELPTDVLTGVKIKVGPKDHEFESTTIVWGNNTPLYPLGNADDIFDINLVNTEKRFIVKDSEYKNDSGESVYAERKAEYLAKFPDEEDKSGDVRVKSDFFDRSKCMDKFAIAEELLPYMSIYDNPYSVIWYDAAVSEEHQRAMAAEGIPHGNAGTNKVDMIRLKKSLKQAGFDPEDKLSLSDYTYTPELTKIMKTVIDLMKDYGWTGYMDKCYDDVKGEGYAGEFKNVHKFNVNAVEAWGQYNTYVTKENTNKAAHEAYRIVSNQTGVPRALLWAVGFCESSHHPANESDNFGIKSGDGGDLRFEYEVVDASGDVSFVHNTDVVGFVNWNGPRIVRRATGTLQTMIWVAENYAPMYEPGAKNNPDRYAYWMVTPYNGVLLAATFFRENIRALEADQAQLKMADIKAIAALPEWQELAEYTGVNAVTLVKYGCTSLMYNKGPNALAARADEFAEMKVTKVPLPPNDPMGRAYRLEITIPGGLEGVDGTYYASPSTLANGDTADGHYIDRVLELMVNGN